MNLTYTYVVLEISRAAYAEIRDKLEVAGYAHAFIKDDGAEAIDMYGIAVRATTQHDPPRTRPLNHRVM